jgi:hypothetical protein
MELIIPLTDEQYERYARRARELGFASLADYVIDLLQESEMNWDDFEKTGDDDDDEAVIDLNDRP